MAFATPRHILRFAAAALVPLLPSCGRQPEPASCGGTADCLASANGVIVGQSASERLAASDELHSAAASYSSWFPGERPVAGLILLDAASADKTSLVRGTFWTLNYAPTAIPALDGGPDMTRPGVLAHEICHHHAAHAFARAWGRSRSLSDMLDEVAAISCETEELRAGRLDLFARLFAEGKLIPWAGFLVTRHPLKADPAMIRSLRELGKSGKGTLTFDIKPGSSQAEKTALFYSQAAAFGEFLVERSCKEKQVIGDLLATYDPRKGLNPWLSSRGARFCLPTSIGAFEESFSQFMKQGNGRPPGIRPRIP